MSALRAALRTPLGPEGFAEACNVSRETLDRLEVYADLLSRWRARINLVGADSLDDLWRRHMLDSAQLRPLVPPTCRRLVDLGSGAGFPGLVLAVMGVCGGGGDGGGGEDGGDGGEVELIESNARKCAFLGAVARATGTAVTITRARIEDIAPRPADVVCARGLAPLDRLLGHVVRFLAPGGTALLLKGARVDEELTQAAKHWTMALSRKPSLSDPTGVILQIKDLRRVEQP